MMLVTGIGLLSAAIPIPAARAYPSRGEASAGRVPLPAAPPGTAAGGFLFSDDFDGPAGSAPDPAKWTVARFRAPIRNPVFWDRPENLGQYRDDRRNVFVDGNSNLVLRATKEGNPDLDGGIAGTYFSGKVQGTWWGGIGTTWEARIKFNCLTAGCWPAWWLSNDDPAVGSEIDLIEWYGNADWPSGTTVHARADGTSFATQPVGVDSGWHRWRVTWNPSGMYFWQDYVDGAQPYFTVPANSLDGWPFNFPDYKVFPVLNLAVGGSGGRDPRPGTYPADMLIDWVRVF